MEFRGRGRPGETTLSALWEIQKQKRMRGLSVVIKLATD